MALALYTGVSNGAEATVFAWKGNRRIDTSLDRVARFAGTGIRIVTIHKFPAALSLFTGIRSRADGAVGTGVVIGAVDTSGLGWHVSVVHTLSSLQLVSSEQVPSRQVVPVVHAFPSVQGSRPQGRLPDILLWWGHTSGNFARIITFVALKRSPNAGAPAVVLSCKDSRLSRDSRHRKEGEHIPSRPNNCSRYTGPRHRIRPLLRWSRCRCRCIGLRWCRHCCRRRPCPPLHTGNCASVTGSQIAILQASPGHSSTRQPSWAVSASPATSPSDSTEIAATVVPESPEQPPQPRERQETKMYARYRIIFSFAGLEVNRPEMGSPVTNAHRTRFKPITNDWPNPAGLNPIP